MKTIIYNGQVVTPYRIIPNSGLIVENGKIADIINDNAHCHGYSNNACGNYDNNNGKEYKNGCNNHNHNHCNNDNDTNHYIQYIDAEGCYISPGFIDMHVHGGGHSDVMDGEPGSIINICKAHSRHGTTSLVPTTYSSSSHDTRMALDAIKAAMSVKYDGAKILGIHMEGPYLSPEQCGAQSKQYLAIPDPAVYLELLDHYNEIIMMSAAPELPGGLNLGRELRSRKILPSIAHSNATFDQATEALENGYTHITHFYSGCSTVHRENAHRIAGVIEAAYLYNEYTVDIIADGMHLPPSLLKLIYKSIGSDRIALISDGTCISGVELKDNTEVVLKNGTRLLYEDGVMKTCDRQSFAGSTAVASRLVRNMACKVGIPLYESVKMASYTPARILGISNKKGSLSIGKDADIVIFDADIDIKMTMVEGKVIFNKR